MECGLFDCPPAWTDWLPPGVWPLASAAALEAAEWDLLALTARGCRLLGTARVRCRELLVPGDCPPGLLDRVAAETVVTCGLSPRDSLTFSSLAEPVLCVQRALPRPGGGCVEPQEFPLPPLPWPPEAALPLLGLWLLQMPLTEGPFPW
ncbi:hypothetical protein [uncultured Oscillibacter sp.]|uniref:hypothetical protein n=1 Tax=uncultured Oscillibacter sp. TaxID=876091 RepID=UPI0025FBC602|nr:hypothetical protein [uncultured Oscillibacter sp.]